MSKMIRTKIYHSGDGRNQASREKIIGIFGVAVTQWGKDNSLLDRKPEDVKIELEKRGLTNRTEPVHEI